MSRGLVLQLLPPSHVNGPNFASPAEVVVGQPEKGRLA